MDFEDKVIDLVCQISEGRVSTYKTLAEHLGKPRAYRAVGNALNKNPNPVEIPCHRVVRSNGGIGGYRDGVRRKEELLKSEGVEVSDGKIDLEKYLFKDF